MITVVGPGAVGGLLAALLARAGEDVTVVARPATALRIERAGITVRSAAFGEWTAAVRVATEPPAGVPAVLAVKAYAVPDVLPALRRALPGQVLALLNGLGHAPVLHAAAELGQVACGSITVESAREDGVIVHRSPFCRVSVPAQASGWEVCSALERAGVTLDHGGTENEVLWRKLSMLAPFALLTTWAEAPAQEALDRDAATTADVVAETAALATASGVPTDPATLTEQLRGLPPTMRSSLQLDFSGGGPTELDALGGELVRRARMLEVPVPALTRMVGELAGRLPG